MPVWVLIALVLAAGQARADEPRSWPEAVAVIAGERDRAARCVRTLYRYLADDVDAIDAADTRYTEARTAMNGVLTMLAGAVLDANAPVDGEALRAELARGVEEREAMCAEIDARIARSEGARDVLSATLGFAEGVVQAATDLLTHYRDERRIIAQSIAGRLDAARWPAWTEVAPSG